jgi:hypothetical protein
LNVEPVLGERELSRAIADRFEWDDVGIGDSRHGWKSIGMRKGREERLLVRV